MQRRIFTWLMGAGLIGGILALGMVQAEEKKPDSTDDVKWVRTWLSEIEVPALPRLERGRELPNYRIVDLKAYAEDISIAEIEKSPEKYPVRKATLDAITVLRGMKKDGLGNSLGLPEVWVQKPGAKMELAKIQRQIALILLSLEEAQEEMDRVQPELEKEKSLRWKAAFQLVQGQLMMRRVHASEYAGALGIIRREDLPELNLAQVHNAWRLKSQARIMPINPGKRLLKAAYELLAKVQKEYADIPIGWLAEQELTADVGLLWESFRQPE